MALIECPDCGREVSSEAEHCLSCGRPIARRKAAPTPDDYLPGDEYGDTQKGGLLVGLMMAIGIGIVLFISRDSELLIARLRGPDSHMEACTNAGKRLCREHAKLIFTRDHCEEYGDRIYAGQPVAYRSLEAEIRSFCASP